MSDNYCEVVAEGIRAYNDTVRYLVDYVDEINDYLEWLPAGEALIEYIQEGLSRLEDEIQRLRSKFFDLIDNTGNPCKLDEFADMWNNSIANPLGDIHGSLDEDADAIVRWEGSGAKAYEKAWNSQREKLSTMQNVAIDVGTQLKDIANAIENFWIAIGLVLVSLAAAVAGAFAGQVHAIVAALLTAIAAVGAEWVALKAAFDTFELSKDAIDQDVEALGEKWPTPKKAHADLIATPGEWERR